MSRKPWETPIEYVESEPAPADPQAEVETVDYTQHVGRERRPSRDITNSGAVNDTSPLSYRKGDPDSILDADDEGE